MVFTQDIYIWSFIRFLNGFSSAFVFIIASNIALSYFNQSKKLIYPSLFYGSLGIGIFISAIVGQYIVSNLLFWQDSWNMLFYISIILTLVTIVFMRPGFTTTVHKPYKSEKVYEFNVVILNTVYFLHGFSYIISGTYLIAIINNLENISISASYIWMICGISAFFAAYFWFNIASKFSFVNAIFTALILHTISIFLLLTDDSFIAIILATVFYGFSALAIVALIMAFGKVLKHHNNSHLVASLTAAFGLGQMISPYITGILAQSASGFFIPLIMGGIA